MSAKLIELIEEYGRIDGSEISHLKEELEEVQAEQDARIAELTAEVARAMEFIEGIGSDLLNRRVADWYPEGAHDAASSMGEDMRLIGNACMDFDIARNALKEGKE